MRGRSGPAWAPGPGGAAELPCYNNCVRQGCVAIDRSNSIVTTHLTRAVGAPRTTELPLLHRIDVRRWSRDALLFCVVLIGYVAGAYLAHYLLDISDLGAIFFVPAGITSAALLLSDRRQWPFVLAAAFIAEVYVDMETGGY